MLKSLKIGKLIDLQPASTAVCVDIKPQNLLVDTKYGTAGCRSVRSDAALQQRPQRRNLHIQNLSEFVQRRSKPLMHLVRNIENTLDFRPPSYKPFGLRILILAFRYWESLDLAPSWDYCCGFGHVSDRSN